MQDLSDMQNNKTTSLFANDSPIAKGEFEPYINREEARFITQSINNLGDGYISATHPCRKEFENEVGGLDFNTVNLSTPISSLPRYIPIVPYQRKDLVKMKSFNYPVMGIGIRDLLISFVRKKAGFLRTKEQYSFRKNILNEYKFNGSVILFSSAPDILIEDLWYRRNDLNLFKIIKEMGFPVSTSMDFSVYESMEPFGQYLNMKKSLIYSQELQKENIIAILNIYSLHKYHRERWLKYLIKNPELNYISICCKIQNRSPEQISVLIKSIKFFIDNTHQDLHILLEGFPINKIKGLEGYLDKIHFADQAAIHYAHCGIEERFNQQKEILEKTDIKDRKKMTKKQKLELSLQNIFERNKMITFLTRKGVLNTGSILIKTNSNVICCSL